MIKEIQYHLLCNAFQWISDCILPEWPCLEIVRIDICAICFSNRMKSNIVGMEANMEQLLEKVCIFFFLLLKSSLHFKGNKWRKKLV